MASLIAIVMITLWTCLPIVSSLECYSCFSYDSNADCERQTNIKRMTCPSIYNTCLKYEMSVKIKELINGETKVVENRGYARYCGKKEDCQNTPQKCPHVFRFDGEVRDCKITCCDDDIDKSKCHERPYWPGPGMGPTSIVTSNDTRTIDKGTNGATHVVVHLNCASMCFTLILGCIIRMLV